MCAIANRRQTLERCSPSGRRRRADPAEPALPPRHRRLGRAPPSIRSGQPTAEAEWQAQQEQWLPSDSDRAFVRSLMQKVTEPGKMASWIAPARSRHQQSADRVRVCALQ